VRSIPVPDPPVSPEFPFFGVKSPVLQWLLYTGARSGCVPKQACGRISSVLHFAGQYDRRGRPSKFASLPPWHRSGELWRLCRRVPPDSANGAGRFGTIPAEGLDLPRVSGKQLPKVLFPGAFPYSRVETPSLRALAGFFPCPWGAEGACRWRLFPVPRKRQNRFRVPKIPLGLDVLCESREERRWGYGMCQKPFPVRWNPESFLRNIRVWEPPSYAVFRRFGGVRHTGSGPPRQPERESVMRLKVSALEHTIPGQWDQNHDRRLCSLGEPFRCRVLHTPSRLLK